MRPLYLGLIAVVLFAGCGPAPGKADRTETGDKSKPGSNAAAGKPSLIGTWVTEKPNEDGSTSTFVIEEGGKITETVKKDGKPDLTFTAEYLKISDKKIEVFAQTIKGKDEDIEVEPYKLLWIDANTSEVTAGKTKIRYVRK